MRDGQFIETEYLFWALNQIKMSLLFWTFCHFFTYLSFLNVKLILKGVPFVVILWKEFAEEHILLFYGSYYLYKNSFLVSTNVFMFAQIMVHYFKMNSYFKANRLLKDQYEIEIKEKRREFSSLYPNNVNFYDFFMFLLHPTFCYEDKYPLQKRPGFRIIAWRLLLVLLGLSMTYVMYADHIVPSFEMFGEINAIESVSSFYFPMMGLYLLMFILLFDFATNFYADISGFADRQFY
jgi:hypothetical protein